MALYDKSRDRRSDPMNPNGHSSWYGGTLLPLIVAAAIAVALIAMMFPRDGERSADTNAGPSVETVAPSPAPTTAPAMPTPPATTEPRPTTP